jgi:small subunit ribosomal protein S11
MAKKADNKGKKVVKQKRYSAKGRLYITATFNNTIVTVTDEKGQTLCWASCGKQGFSGTRKATPHASTTAIEAALKRAREENGLAEVATYIRGAGPGRDAVLRVLRSIDLEVSKIVDMTPIPHDGIRPKKRRRV